MSKARKKLEPVTCGRCGHTWRPRAPDPERCPACQTPDWRTPAVTSRPSPVPAAPEPGTVMQVAAPASNPVSMTTAAPEPPAEPCHLKLASTEVDVKPGPKKERREKAKKEKLPPGKVSAQHPAAYELAATFLPKSPALLLLLGLTFSAVSSMIVGNYLFVMDWYRGSIVLPWLLAIWTYAGGPGQWLSDYWPLLALLACLALSLAFVTWSLPWRFCFKDYIVIRGNTKSKDGRVMWSTDNVWTRMWDNMYGTPPRDTVELWLKHRLLWNPLLPQRGLVKLTLDRKEEKPEFDGLFTFTAEERRYRKYVGLDEMITTDDAQQTRPIPLQQANANFAVRGKHLVKDTQQFSLANPQVRLEKLKTGTHIVPQDLQEAAEIAREQRHEG